MMIQTSKYKKILMLLLALHPFFAAAQTPIIVENFGYTAGDTLRTINGAGWIPVGTVSNINKVPVVSPGLSYTGSTASGIGNAVSIKTTGEDIGKAFAQNYKDNAIYTSFLINVSAAQATGDYFFCFIDSALSATNYRARTFIKSSGTGFKIGVSKSGSGIAAGFYANDLSFNTTYQIVIKYSIITGLTNDSVKLFVNPVLGASEPITAGAEALTTENDITISNIVGIGGVVLRQGTVTNAPTLTFDGLIVGRTWSSVTTLSNSSGSTLPSYVPTTGLVGYWPFSGNANDASGNGYNLTNYNVTYDIDKSQNTNACAYFSGNASYLKSQTAFSQITSSPKQSYSFWFKNLQSNWRYIVNYGNSTKSRIGIVPNTLAATKSVGLEGTNGCINCGVSGGIATINTPGLDIGWHHVVVSVELNNYSVYYDGTLMTTQTHTGFNCVDSAFRFVLGNDVVCSPEYYNMYLDDIGVWDRSLTLSEVTALYNQASNPVLPSYVPTTGLVAYYPFNGNANDASGNGNNGTILGGVNNTTDKFGNANSALLFDGVNGHITISSLNSLAYKPITYSAWVIVNSYLPTTSGHKFRSIVGRNTEFVTENGVIGLYADNNVNAGAYNNTFLMWRGGGVTVSVPSSASIPVLNTWIHIVYTQELNGNWKWYQNGTLTNSGNFTDIQNDFNYFQIGGCNNQASSNTYWNGKLDDIGIWNRALTQSEVTALYNQASNPVLPSYVPTTGLVAYYPFNGNANDLSGNAYNLTQVGTNVIAKNDRFNNLNSSYYFGGANPENKFNFPTSFYPAYNSLNSGSISFWMNIDSIVDHSHYFGFDNTFFVKQKNGQNSESYIGLSNGKIRFHMTGALPASNMQVDVKQLVTKKWYNLTVSWTPSNLYIYIDGLLSSSFSGNFGLSNTPSPDFISIGGFYGTGGTGCYSSIDDFGIWNRALTQSEITALSNMPNTSTNDTLSIVNTQSDTLIFPNKIKVSLKSNDLSSKNIISYEIKLSYDQTKLIFDSVSLNNTASANGLIVTNNNTTGLLKLVWARSTKLTGTLPLLNCFFSPIDSGKSKINIIYALFNTDTVRNLKSKTLINKYNFGDIDLNSFIQAYDGMVALRYSVGMDPIPLIDPLPWENWRVKVASVDSSVIVTANDASLILKYVVGLINQFPKRGLNYSNGYVLTSIENNEIVFRSFGNLQGLNVSFLNQFDKLNPASFIFSNDAISAVNILDNIYKVGIAFNNSPEPGSIILKIPISGELKNDLNIELYENENKRLINLNKSTSITSESKTNHLIFPNPTTNLVNVIGLGKTETEVSIYDIQGKLILSRKIIDQGIIDMSDLYNGVYLLKIGEVVHRVTKL